MGKQTRARILGDHQAMAVARNIRVSPRKLNLVAQQIRGLKVERDDCAGRRDARTRGHGDDESGRNGKPVAGKHAQRRGLSANHRRIAGGWIGQHEHCSAWAGICRHLSLHSLHDIVGVRNTDIDSLLLSTR